MCRTGDLPVLRTGESIRGLHGRAEIALLLYGFPFLPSWSIQSIQTILQLQGSSVKENRLNVLAGRCLRQGRLGGQRVASVPEPADDSGVNYEKSQDGSTADSIAL